ncbi:MAG: adenosylcobalamin-dependent ribonucleoside-diphosphate reductase [Syntrophothermus sp.]
MQLNEWLNNKLQTDIWKKKYQYENETLDEFFDRVSAGNENIRQLMVEKKFLPAGRILANRGLQHKGKRITYSNCYVSTTGDSLEEIFECAYKIARTFSTGGGIGFDISKLAPKGAKINNAAKETTGVTSFMELYSMITGIICQANRRGALIITLDCNHPDLEDFINIKSDLTKVTKANISIKITNEFMDAVKNNEDYLLYFKRNETGEEITKLVNARKIFNRICELNWKTAEPGMLFIDTINDWCLLSEDKSFIYESCNPCSEAPLPVGGSCLLGSINLSEFIVNEFTDKAYFDYNKFSHVIFEAVKYLNEVLEEGLPLHPLQEQRDSVNDWRQIGLGVMGIADMLIKLGIVYGSEESIKLCNQIGFALTNYAIKQSALLAKEKGTYPKYNKKAILRSPFFKHNVTDRNIIKLVEKYGLRNSQLLAIAPTGTLSTMLGISGGIEPIFALSYKRKTESLHGKDEYYEVNTQIVDDYLDYYDTDKDNLPEQFVTSHDIHYIDRINMQSVWQKHIDAAISSTVNLKESATIEEVQDLYMYAWGKGIKGITVYRDGCEREGILTTDKKEKLIPNNIVESINNSNLYRGYVEPVPDDLTYRKFKLTTGCSDLYLFVGVNEKEKKIYDCFTNTDGIGGCMVNTIANSRLLSVAMRGGISIEFLVQQLDKSGTCPSYQSVRGKQNAVKEINKIVSNYIPDEIKFKINKYSGKPISQGKSCASAISYIIKNIIKEFNNLEHDNIDYEITSKNDIKKEIECTHKNTYHTNGCVICPDCGYSKCD